MGGAAGDEVGRKLGNRNRVSKWPGGGGGAFSDRQGPEGILARPIGKSTVLAISSKRKTEK